VSQGDVGLFYLSLGIVGLFGIWKELGLPSALIRYVPYYESKGQYRKARDLLLNTYAVNVALGISLTLLLWAGADAIGAAYRNPMLSEALKIMSFYMLVDNVFKVNVSYLQGKAEMKFSQIVGTLQVLSKLTLTVILFEFYGPTIFSLTLSLLASTLLAIIISFPFIAKKAAHKTGDAQELTRVEIWKEIAPFGIMLTAIQTFYSVMSAADRVILGYLAPPAVASEFVAIYSFASGLGMNLMVFPGAVGVIFLPVISRLAGKDEHSSIQRQVGTSQRWVLFITIPMAAVMIAFSGEMLSTFYGESYEGGGTAMALFMVGLVFMVFAHTVSLALAGMRLVKIELKVAVISSIVNVLLNLILIPVIGVDGAALAAAGSFAVWSWLILDYGKKIIGFETPVGAYKLILAGTVCIALIFLLKPAIALIATLAPIFGDAHLQAYVKKVSYLILLGTVAVAASAVFWLLSIYLKCFEDEDLRVMKKIAQKTGLPTQIVHFCEKMLSHGIAKR
jgi:stage V sporulation protein B